MYFMASVNYRLRIRNIYRCLEMIVWDTSIQKDLMLFLLSLIKYSYCAHSVCHQLCKTLFRNPKNTQTKNS